MMTTVVSSSFLFLPWSVVGRVVAVVEMQERYLVRSTVVNYYVQRVFFNYVNV